MIKRLLVVVGIVVWLGIGAVVASATWNVDFNDYGWVLVVAVLAGVVGGGIKGRRGTTSRIVGDRVFRHDAFGTFMEHWAHAAATLLLIGTGILLGFLFVPRLSAPDRVVYWVNLHFFGSVLLVFSLGYHGANHLMANDQSILPKRGDLAASVNELWNIIGRGTQTTESKYKAIERVEYLVIAVALAVIVGTGGVKTLAHYVFLSSTVVGTATLLHDVGTLFLGVVVAGHIAFTTLIPTGWPYLRSMVTGWIPSESVREKHGQWYEDIRKER